MSPLVFLLLLVASLRADAVDLEVEGLCPAVYTPFDDDGKLNVAAVPTYAKYLKNNRINGVLLAGTSGEGPGLSLAERKALLTAWLKEGKRLGIRVIMQVGGLPLPEVLELAQFSESAGADAIMTLPELYYKPANDSAVVRYLGIVSNAAPKLPILYYDHSTLSGVKINAPKFHREATATVPNYRGLKCDFDSALGIAATGHLHEGQRLFMMNHISYASNVHMGFNSAMTGAISLFPKLFLAIMEAVNSKDFDKARELQNELNARVSVIISQGDYVPFAKAAFEIITGIRIGSTRDPLKLVSIEQVRIMEKALREIDAKYAIPPEIPE